MKNSILIVILLFFIFNLTAAGYSGGNGTRNNPYKIKTAKDLISLMRTSSDWNKHFKQIADINLKKYGGKVKPIGNKSRPFTGIYNGAKHKILINPWISSIFIHKYIRQKEELI